MRTDLQVNYGELELICQRICSYREAIEALEEKLDDLKGFLEEQETEAVAKLLEKVNSAKIGTEDRKTTLWLLEGAIKDYNGDMRGLIREVTEGQVTRVDKVDIAFNLRQIKATVGTLDRCTNSRVESGNYVSFGKDEEERRKRERNYNKLEEVRVGTLCGLARRLASDTEELYRIYDNSVEPYESMDDVHRRSLNTIYEERTSQKDKNENFWEGFGKITEAFLEGFAVAAAITIAVVLAPAWAVVGVVVLAAAGCVVLANVPEENVPEWMSKAKEMADEMSNLAQKSLEDGPIVLVEALGQGLIDQMQTPEGIASLAGEISGATVGSLAGAKLKVKMSEKPAAQVEMVETSYGKSSTNYKSTADFMTNVEGRNGKYYTDKTTIDEVGRIEARGEDFSILNKKIMSSRASTEGGISIVYKYSDEFGTKYLVHEVTDANGYSIHRDFDAVRISSGQLINKGH